MDSYDAWKAFESSGRVTDYMEYRGSVDGQSNIHKMERKDANWQNNISGKKDFTWNTSLQ